MDTSAATGKMHAPGSGGVPEKCSVPGGEKRMTKLLHGNEKTSLNGGREPLFSQKELLVLAGGEDACGTKDVTGRALDA